MKHDDLLRTLRALAEIEPALVVPEPHRTMPFLSWVQPPRARQLESLRGFCWLLKLARKLGKSL